MSFAERLRISRKERGYSQEKLAEELEVSRQTVTKWEAGLSYPEIRTLILLASRLRKNLDWLLYDEKNTVSGPDAGGADPAYLTDRVIYDKPSLKRAMEQDLILKFLRAMDLMEFREDMETEAFSGVRAYTVYDGTVYTELEGTDPETGRPTHSFTELEFHGMQDFLPWLETVLTNLFIRNET